MRASRDEIGSDAGKRGDDGIRTVAVVEYLGSVLFWWLAGGADAALALGRRPSATWKVKKREAVGEGCESDQVLE